MLGVTNTPTPFQSRQFTQTWDGDCMSEDNTKYTKYTRYNMYTFYTELKWLKYGYTLHVFYWAVLGFDDGKCFSFELNPTKIFIDLFMGPSRIYTITAWYPIAIALNEPTPRNLFCIFSWSIFTDLFIRKVYQHNIISLWSFSSDVDNNAILD